MNAKALVRRAEAMLRDHADPAKAAPMAAYMKTTQAFFGVPATARREIARALKKEFPPADQGEYETLVLALWNRPRREEQYLAVSLAQAFRSYINPSSMPLYERLIREGAWWDFVDDVAVHLVGDVYRRFRNEIEPWVDRWIIDGDFWIRRSAMLSHLQHKEFTDRDRLFRYCRACLHEKEFFIRKAIGWVLREYSKTDPEAVRAFVNEHQSQMSGLSIREATRLLPD